MTVGEWMDAHPKRNMRGLRLRSPDGAPWTLANAWRVGDAEPASIGVMLHEGDANSGTIKTTFLAMTEWRAWEVR